ncbi:MAG: transglycosylase domain-containing protein [Gammaproteobacteria bacterium]|nr:transglycosylase domain-containing protein [Gammaproteobacteria bacterium]MBU1654060.1 transglycosylase domain-containing protein [Gammaproteobacteria bacterium]MBU1962367.1 transglycosylase domain-containing protein [Gammaproteobacteria bacterium]
MDISLTLAKRIGIRLLGLPLLLGCTWLLVATWLEVTPITGPLRGLAGQAEFAEITDRTGAPLRVSYQNRWNSFDYLPLHAMPEFLLQAFIASEDKRFYSHPGVDWRSLGGAVWQNLRSLSRVRGGSTISGQVVRIIHERPRNLWSKWIELWETLSLERHAGKREILEFYCNQLPYAANRRGVSQAASYYFDRDLSTLTKKEMLALVVLARAPSAYDLYRHPERAESAILALARKLREEGMLRAEELSRIERGRLKLARPELPVEATHFVRHVRNHDPQGKRRYDRPLRTTLDGGLQRRVQEILGQRLKRLARLRVHNAAALVADHRTAEVLAWVVAGGDEAVGAPNPTHKIDAVTVPRQPGSALKPFLYALALEKGWTPATIVEDSPLAETIGSGLHEFKNYSRSHYGKVSLREALGNSLNIPALRTIGFVGVEEYLGLLHRLGFASLNRDAAIYNDGLALGNGEVSLLEMVQAYAALAHRGEFRPLRWDRDDQAPRDTQQIYSPEAASLTGNILSDPWARRLEFGYGSVLNLPIQTAVKTGTSTDYHDAWTLGFDSRYVVGVWMGNLDRSPMDGVTGAIGPALALRSIFAELQRDKGTQPLYLSPRLVRKEICQESGGDRGEQGNCRTRTEYFIPGSENGAGEQAAAPPITLARPTPGLQMAFDPRIPADYQIFPFRIEGLGTRCAPDCAVSWYLNGQLLAVTPDGNYRWPVRRGRYDLRVEVLRGAEMLFASDKILFWVK